MRQNGLEILPNNANQLFQQHLGRDHRDRFSKAAAHLNGPNRQARRTALVENTVEITDLSPTEASQEDRTAKSPAEMTKKTRASIKQKHSESRSEAARADQSFWKQESRKAEEITNEKDQ